MKFYDKHFSINENSKNFCFEISCFNRNSSQGFFHEKTQSVTGSYHADKLHLVVLAIKVNFNIFTWKYVPKK